MDERESEISNLFEKWALQNSMQSKLRKKKLLCALVLNTLPKKMWEGSNSNYYFKVLINQKYLNEFC